MKESSNLSKAIVYPVGNRKFSFGALSVGILAMAFLIGYIVLAWTEPSQAPPGGNVPAPINVGSTAQTKAGNLTLPNLYLNAVGNEGNIYSANIIQGYNDLILYGSSAKNVPIYLEGNPVVINNDAGTGNVGIGTTAPNEKLTIEGSLSLREISAPGATANYGKLYVKTDGHIYFKNDANQEFDLTQAALGGYWTLSGSNLYPNNTGWNVGIGTTNPGYKLHIDGCPSGSACLKLTGGDAKIDAGLVDPIFTINGKNYATYMADFAGGTRVETSGTIQLTTDNLQPKAVIDFDNLEEGSNLWLFWQASNKNLKDVAVLLTPGFEGNVWYEKTENSIIIHGEKDGEVSFRLSSPRVDYQKWGNVADDQSLKGIIIE